MGVVIVTVPGPDMMNQITQFPFPVIGTLNVPLSGYFVAFGKWEWAVSGSQTPFVTHATAWVLAFHEPMSVPVWVALKVMTMT